MPGAMENILRLCASECKGDVKEKPSQRDTQRARNLQVRIVSDFQGTRWRALTTL